MTVEELKALDLERAAKFYGGFPDGQWDKEAAVFLSLAPEILALVEAVDIEWLTQFQGQKQCRRLFDALATFNAKLEAL